MVDALVSTVIQQLAIVLQKEIEQEVRLVMGVKKEVEKLSRTFTRIRVVLKDAEDRQFMDETVKLWLRDLKDVAYDIDDVLDEWSTAIFKSQIEDNWRSGVDHDHARHTGSSSTFKKVCPGNLFSPPSCCFTLKQVGLRRDIGHRIKEINERLDEIASLQEKFHFIHETTKTRNVEIFDKNSKGRQETSSSIDVSEVFGRDKDRDIIISKLLGEGSSSQQQHQQLIVFARTIPVISIMGMGGLGKTTLAQLVFNDDRVEKHFGKRMWVHVGSQSFDKMKVAIDIIKQIGGTGDSSYQGGDNNNSWQYVHDLLNKFVDGKHFLLVLDDVWNEDVMEWDPLRQSLRRGSQESRIIITTRNLEVANMMGATYIHRLEILHEEACWSLLRHYAFTGRQQEECEKLEEIGRKLAKKCKGLPLSAKTLGGLLCSKRFRQDWQSVLDNDLWAILSTGDKRILPSLIISYNDFPSQLKQCFGYCSVIPRGSLIYNKFITNQWMAQGFLSDHTGACSDDFYRVGDEYINHLVMRSFFQKDVTKTRGEREFYQMHDLVHDFLKYLEENACLTLTIRDTTEAEKFDLSRARHLSLILEGINTIPSFIYKAKALRTCKLYGRIPKISSELFDHLRCLRTLDLFDTSLELLPNEIEKLIHLRYLDLSKARFKELPESLTNLYNLQILRLYHCRSLCKLPAGIGRMINLVEFDLRECRQLSYVPEGIGRLTKLQRLSYIILGGVERVGGCKIEELKDLNLLHGTLCITGLRRLENGSEAKAACLKNKQHLRALYFYFDQFTGMSRVDEYGDDEEAEAEEKEEEEGEEEAAKEKEVQEEEEEEEEKEDMLLRRRMEDVLEGLQPPPSIEKLSIREYPGVVFPNWLGSPTECINLFSNLVFLEIKRCRKWKRLPSTLGKLSSLETLIITGMDEVKFMDVEFFGIDDDDDDARAETIVFAKLKVFMLGGMQNLEEWDVRLQVEDRKNKVGLIFMPCLRYLYFDNLPKLRSIPQHITQSTSLRKLLIWDSPNLTWMLPSTSLSHLPTPPSFPNVEELILKEDAGSLSKSLSVNNVVLFPKLKLLRVRVSPYSSLPHGLGQLTSLEVLDIRTCSKIKSIIPQGEEEGLLHCLPALLELRIVRSPALRRSCQKGMGEDWSKISHIPKIFIDDQKIK